MKFDFDSIQLDSVRFRFDSVRFGSISIQEFGFDFDSVRFDLVRFDRVSFDSAFDSVFDSVEFFSIRVRFGVRFCRVSFDLSSIRVSIISSSSILELFLQPRVELTNVD